MDLIKFNPILWPKDGSSKTLGQSDQHLILALGYGRILSKLDRAEAIHERRIDSSIDWQGDGGVVYKRSPLVFNDFRNQMPTKISDIFQFE